MFIWIICLFVVVLLVVGLVVVVKGCEGLVFLCIVLGIVFMIVVCMFVMYGNFGYCLLGIVFDMWIVFVIGWILKIMMISVCVFVLIVFVY